MTELLTQENKQKLEGVSKELSDAFDTAVGLHLFLGSAKTKYKDLSKRIDTIRKRKLQEAVSEEPSQEEPVAEDEMTTRANYTTLSPEEMFDRDPDLPIVGSTSETSPIGEGLDYVSNTASQASQAVSDGLQAIKDTEVIGEATLGDILDFIPGLDIIGAGLGLASLGTAISAENTETPSIQQG